jgi:hypothetical protein
MPSEISPLISKTDFPYPAGIFGILRSTQLKNCLACGIKEVSSSVQQIEVFS